MNIQVFQTQVIEGGVEFASHMGIKIGFERKGVGTTVDSPFEPGGEAIMIERVMVQVQKTEDSPGTQQLSVNFRVSSSSLLP